MMIGNTAKIHLGDYAERWGGAPAGGDRKFPLKIWVFRLLSMEYHRTKR
ncbi:MAG: hypothetical protein KME59_20150 [Trichormus sp. ATA11-4-KO1]|jgi:hypothetical protein|nr:hypothetical protein [Trichormus sp. ATA11-4-KO1]